MNSTVVMSADQEEDEQEENYQPTTKLPTSGVVTDFQETATIPKQMVLIALIGDEPAIFNPKHDDYRNPLKKDDLWKEISERVGWTEQHCKNKWKAMRDQYCRELKRTRNNAKAVIKWKYFQPLDFLRPYALYRNYRPRMSTKSDSQQLMESESEETNKKHHLDESTLDEEKPCFNLKSEDWSIYTDSSQMNDTSDITSQIMDQLSQADKKEHMEEEPPDDEDDDPIHTFLNIESYFEKELITMIQAEEVLYNMQHPSYRNAKVKLKVWEEIARKLKRTVRQCRLKWKALRDQYIREHKRILFLNKDCSLSRWKHYDALGFLEKFIRQKSLFDRTQISIQKHELGLPFEQFDQEQMITPSTEEDLEMSEDVLRDEVTTEIFADCRHSTEILEEDPDAEQFQSKLSCLTEQQNGSGGGGISNTTPIEDSIDAQAAKDDNDEVGAFFRAIAMKIRKANMSSVAFTELQINILQVITNVLKEH